MNVTDVHSSCFDRQVTERVSIENFQGDLKEARLEEGGGVCDEKEQGGWEISRHHLRRQLSSHLYHQLDPLFGIEVIFINKMPVGEEEDGHACLLHQPQVARNQSNLLPLLLLH